MIMMCEKLESLFSFFGARNHRTEGYQLLTSAGSLPERHPVLQEYESNLAEKLDALRKAGEERGFLSIDWLLQALSVVVNTHADVQALIPSLTREDDKWMSEYLDDSSKLLEVCNELKKGIRAVEVYPKLVQAAIRWLEGKDRSYYIARKALQGSMESWRGGESELESCSSMLRTMGKKLVNPKASGSGFFNVAIYGAKVTTIFLCSFIVDALTSCKTRRPRVLDVHISKQCLWASSLLSLHHRVKEETDERKTKCSSNALLAELHDVDMLVCCLHGIVDQKLKSSIPLLGEADTVDVLMRRFHGAIEKSALVFNASEVEELDGLVASLAARSKGLDHSLNSLYKCTRQLFQLLNAN